MRPEWACVRRGAGDAIPGQSMRIAREGKRDRSYLGIADSLDEQLKGLQPVTTVLVALTANVQRRALFTHADAEQAIGAEAIQRLVDGLRQHARDCAGINLCADAE